MLEFDMSDISKMHYFHSIEVVQCLAEIFIFSKETCPINFRHISNEELQSHHYSNWKGFEACDGSSKKKG